MISTLLLKYKYKLLLATTCYLGLVLLSSISPLYLSRLVDELACGINARGQVLVASASFIVGSSAFKILVNFFLTKHIGRISITMSTQIRTQVLRHYLCADKNQLPQTGDFLTAMLRDTGRVVGFVTRDLNSILVSLSSFVGVSIVLAKMNIALYLACALFIPLYWLVHKIFASVRYELSKDLRETHSSLTTRLSSVAKHQRTTFLHRCQDFVLRKALAAIHRCNDSEYKNIGNRAWSGLALSGISFLMGAIGLLLGTIFVVRGRITVGMMMAFTTYSGRLLSPVGSLTELALSWQDTRIAIENLKRYDAKGLQVALRSPQKSELVGVVFDEVKPYSKGFCLQFSMELGKTTSLIGPTGAGKSTICEGLAGYMKPVSGHIRYRLRDGSLLNPESVQDQIMLIDTHMELFEEETIIENLTLGRKVSREAIFEALNVVELFSLFEERNIRLSDTISDVGFSHGEAQRLLIARGLLWDARIMILDEALSGIDPELSARIVQRLRAKVPKIVTVSHRASDHNGAERSYSVEKGSVQLLQRSYRESLA